MRPRARPTAVARVQAIEWECAGLLARTPFAVAADEPSLALALPEAYLLPLRFAPGDLSALLWSLCEQVLLA